MTLVKPERIDWGADGWTRAMILMQYHRNGRVGFHRCEHHVPQKRLPRIFARAGRSLQDHRAAGLVRGLHDRLDLLQVVDIKGGHAVVELSGMIEQLTQGNESHGYVNSGF